MKKIENPVEEEILTAIVGRFYEAIELLIKEKVLRGKQTFTTKYGINKRNFYSLRSNPTGKVSLAWLAYLVNDYKISAHWLLAGQGEVFATGWNADMLRELFPIKRKPMATKTTQKTGEK